MIASIRTRYEHTIYASYIGYITQAIVNNFAPLLFLTFQRSFQLSLEQITLITTVNFLVQLCVDLISVRVVDRIGYRVSAVAAHFFATVGLVGMAFFPDLFGNSYVGLMTAVVLYAIGGGIIEVIISPIVEACPTEKKEAAMSLLHSFYCWGHVGVVLLSTAFFALAGIQNWRIMACIWALIPAFNLVYFSQVPLYPIVGDNEGLTVRSLFGKKVFWLFMLLMVSAGAAEHAMSQWSSAFAEAGLRVDKTIGDLAGPAGFALLMGLARLLHGKYSDHIPLKQMMMGSAGLCIVCYLLAGLSRNPVLGLIGCALCGFSVGIFWPGTVSIAARTLPTGGTAMFAFLALAGDLGCASGPTLVGFAADASNGDLRVGMLLAVIFPVILLTGLLTLRESSVVEEG
ncbi:MAG: MFS transporter [Firmicutes bacterium]|jgi:MFS family permease|nr:MFS transporter [Bacillota bacterium]